MTDDLKTYTPAEIAEVPFPDSSEESFTSSQKTGGGETYTPKTTPYVPFQPKKIAHELMSASLNTRTKKILATYEFTPSGAIQIGNYEEGVSGDIRISPDGIVARNRLGDVTFTLEGDTGDATFAGTIRGGTVIGGDVIVGNNTIILRGDPDNAQILFFNGEICTILLGRVS